MGDIKYYEIHKMINADIQTDSSSAISVTRSSVIRANRVKISQVHECPVCFCVCTSGYTACYSCTFLIRRISCTEELLQILETHRLILSQTSSVNLMAIPTYCTREVQKRIKEAENNPEVTSDILLVAQMELAFLLSKECVSFYTCHVAMDRLIKYQEEDISPAIIFTSVQVYLIHDCHWKSN